MSGIKADFARLAYKLIAVPALGLAAASCQAATDRQIAENIEEGMRDAPGGADLFDTLEREFPEEYAELVQRLVALDRQGGDISGVEEAVAPVLLPLYSRLGPEIARAPQKELFEYRDRRIAAMRSFAAHSPELCAQVAFGPTARLEARPKTVEDKRLTAELQAAFLRAAAAAKRDPHLRTEPTEADGNVFGARLGQSALTDADLDLMASEERLLQAPPETQCRIGTEMYQAVAEIPLDSAERMTAYLLSS